MYCTNNIIKCSILSYKFQNSRAKKANSKFDRKADDNYLKNVTDNAIQS